MRLLILMLIVVGLCAAAKKQRTTRATTPNPLTFMEGSDDELINDYDNVQHERYCNDEENTPPENRTAYCRLSKKNRMKMLWILAVRRRSLKSIADFIAEYSRKVPMLHHPEIIDPNKLPESLRDLAFWRIMYYNRPGDGFALSRTPAVRDFVNVQLQLLKPAMSAVKELMSPKDQAIMDAFIAVIPDKKGFQEYRGGSLKEEIDALSTLQRYSKLANEILQQISAAYE